MFTGTDASPGESPPAHGRDADAAKTKWVAARGERIVAVGEGGGFSALVGEGTEICDFGQNAFIMPGIHDNHVHLVLAGMLDKYPKLYGAPSQESCAAAAAGAAAKYPDEEWVIGFGFCRLLWDNMAMPHRSMLDRYVPDRPVILLDSELHAAWVNTKALSLAGVDKNTPDPPFGKIERDADGTPSGYLVETALSLAAKKAFEFTPQIAEDLIARYASAANRFGITSVSDMTPYLGIDLSCFDSFAALARSGKLTLRVNAAFDLFSDPRELMRKAGIANSIDGGMYRVSYMKQFIDGILANYTAMMLDGYTSNPGEKGGPLLPLDMLHRAVADANAHGIPVRLHACGDGAVRTALDAFKASNEAVLSARRGEGGGTESPTPVRNQIEHIEVIDPSDIARFASLGVIASVQPEHIVSGINSHSENCYPEYLGSERERHTWPFRTMLDAGARLAMGSDAPVVAGSPFEGIYTGMTRVHTDGTPEGGWNPSEKLTAEQLLRGYTKDAAFAEMRESELGTLEAGKLADIAVIDRDLLTAKPEDIREAKALMTVCGGRVVHRE
jgi:predicted amidohydrolase YtcJ